MYFLFSYVYLFSYNNFSPVFSWNCCHQRTLISLLSIFIHQHTSPPREREREKKKKIKKNDTHIKIFPLFLGKNKKETMKFPIIFLQIIFIFAFKSCPFSAEPDQSIYQVLSSHGLPMGLLPKGVNEFSFDNNGRFEAHLEQACNARFESVVHYDRNVSGTISYGQIRGLSGISAQELFLWFPVKGIRVDIPSSGLIYFDVGVIYKQFSLSLFETPRDCTVVSDGIGGGTGVGPDLREGEAIAEAVAKSLSGKHRYELDQGYVQKAVA